MHKKMVQWVKNNRRNPEKAKQNRAKKNKIQSTERNSNADDQVLVTEDHNIVPEIGKIDVVDYLDYDDIEYDSDTNDNNKGIENNGNENDSSYSDDVEYQVV